MITTGSFISLSLLLVDDDESIRRILGEHLKQQGYRVYLAESGSKALEVLGKERIDIVITDIRMPGMDGFEVLKRVREKSPDTEVIVVTGYGDIDGEVQALQEGAFDYFTKPLNVHDITASLQRTAAFFILQQENERLRERFIIEGREHYGLATIVGESGALRQVKSLIVQVSQTENTTVLIEGETGTGKELVARAIHFESARAQGPFVAVDCSAIPQHLVEDELYGHMEGAFTDARDERRGRFELADGGTLFLDEIGDMDVQMQSRLLRTLEERRVQRLGGSEEIPVDVRVVSATNLDLEQAVSQDAFREDLFYRLNTFKIRIPPLRDRPEDIMPLARHFQQRYAREMRKSVEGFSTQAQNLLEAHPFPGNIRELKNMVERAIILCASGQVTGDDLEFGRSGRTRKENAVESDSPGVSPPEVQTLNIADLEKQAIQQALKRCGGNKVHAARLLGITREALRRRMKRYQIEDPA